MSKRVSGASPSPMTRPTIGRTLAFFDRARRGEIDALISTVVLDEIDRAELGLREKLTTLVREISPAFVELSSEALQLSEAFVRERNGTCLETGRRTARSHRLR